MEWGFSDDIYVVPNCYQDYIGEEDRVIGLDHAVEELDNGAQFSFYDLRLSEYEEQRLSQLKISEHNNLVIYTSQVVNLKEHIGYRLDELIGIGLDNPDFLSDLISRLVSNILGVTGHENAEIVLRTEGKDDVDESHISNKCTYWHIDKSHGEIAKNIDFSGYSIGIEEEQKLFIISLIGDTTLFRPINDQQRNEFLNAANETNFFYGHSLPENCFGQDAISLLFNNEDIVSAGKGYGSVHIAGKNGTIHAAPNKHSDGRLVLLITPI